ncbi:hypothetical protein NYP20_13815 [Pseudomonas sp. N3-W]|uniref:hypothetical protein n=1 Tax=Pseudomonas sp. N3-W TaxID=2975049 RepID=UPI00217D2E34|nr:hypothetical protein [Pseudomonas sp. N3-W]UWF51977.1 hypothetical protein NYP20_13815 [Pseudomonas sp. N3-W]
MGVLMDVVTTVGVAGSLLIGWTQLTDQKRLELRARALKLLVFISVLVVVGSGGWETIKFGLSDAPLKRMDILWLLANLWNMIFYLVVGVALAAYWTNPNRAKEKAETVSTPDSQ